MCGARIVGVSGEPARRGRPRGFDPERAVECATRLFWERGYHDTSVADLGCALGLSAPSLYAAWESKEGLFCRCLEHYWQTVGIRPLEALRDAPTFGEGIALFLEALSSNPAGSPRGCFLLASVLHASSLPSQARKLIGQLRIRRKRLIVRLVADARERGEIDCRVDVGKFASLLSSFGLAIAVESRAVASPRLRQERAGMLRAILVQVASGRVRLE